MKNTIAIAISAVLMSGSVMAESTALWHLQQTGLAADGKVYSQDRVAVSNDLTNLTLAADLVTQEELSQSVSNIGMVERYLDDADFVTTASQYNQEVTDTLAGETGEFTRVIHTAGGGVQANTIDLVTETELDAKLQNLGGGTPDKAIYTGDATKARVTSADGSMVEIDHRTGKVTVGNGEQQFSTAFVTEATLDRAIMSIEPTDTSLLATKEEVGRQIMEAEARGETVISTKADISYVDSELAGKADIGYVNTATHNVAYAAGQRIDELDVQVKAKAEAGHVDTEVARLDTALATKADTTYVDQTVNETAASTLGTAIEFTTKASAESLEASKAFTIKGVEVLADETDALLATKADISYVDDKNASTLVKADENAARLADGALTQAKQHTEQERVLIEERTDAKLLDKADVTYVDAQVTKAGTDANAYTDAEVLDAENRAVDYIALQNEEQRRITDAALATKVDAVEVEAIQTGIDANTGEISNVKQTAETNTVNIEANKVEVLRTQRKVEANYRATVSIAQDVYTVNRRVDKVENDVAKNSAEINLLKQADESLKRDIAELDARMDATNASLHAVTNARPFLSTEGEFAIGAGAGFAGDAQAVAIGGAYAISSQLSVSGTVHITTGAVKDVAGGAGVQYSFK